MPHPYIPNDHEETIREIMKSIGIKDVEELYSDVPYKIRLKRRMKLPDPHSEMEAKREIERMLRRNSTVKELISFLGAGVWNHYVPAVIDEIVSRGEFLTSYTPYQAEISQGMLQALFEYQSMICELLEMDVANCSMYDWSSSLGEAARMAVRVTGRREIIIPHYISPERLAVLKAYSEPAGIRILEVKQKISDGQIDLEDLKCKVSDKTAAVYVENPSYLGFIIEDVKDISEIIHDADGLFIVGVDPSSLGVLKPPGDYGADIVVGEGQPLGNYMSMGGSLLGIFACRSESRLIRQMPGRIVGMTRTKDGRSRAFCLALQTREQHIRRHRATSNICTNASMTALRAAVYMALLGPEGFKELSEIILSKTYYMIKRLSRIDGVKTPIFKSAHFKEFTVNYDQTSRSVDYVNRELLKNGILGGKPLNSEFPELGETSLFCVTELTSLEEMDRLLSVLEDVLGG